MSLASGQNRSRRTARSSLDGAKAHGPRARVLNHLRERIASGALASGEALPTALSLSQELGVNRRTVHAALQILDDEGVIRTDGGRLRRVADGAASQRGSGRGTLHHTIVMLMLTPRAGTSEIGDESEGANAQSSDGKRRGNWLDAMNRGVESRVQRSGLHVLKIHPDRVDEAEIARLLTGHPFGAVVTDFGHSEQVLRLAQLLEEQDVPAVIYGGWPALAPYDRVTSDHAEGAYRLAKFLMERGRRRIAQVWPRDASGYWYAERQRGYERALREADLEPLPVLRIRSPWRELSSLQQFEDAARDVAADLLSAFLSSEPFDALMVHEDVDAARIIAACRFFGKEPNRDLDIVGYDNGWLASGFDRWEPMPPLATVDKRDFAIGQELAQLLMERTKGQLPPEPQHRVVAPELVVCSPTASTVSTVG